jgi:Bacteriocin-protection, YdeI or OmpD-Associated
VPGGVVHKLPEDLRKALVANPAALDAWTDITPLARNEFICWVEEGLKPLLAFTAIRLEYGWAQTPITSNKLRRLKYRELRGRELEETTKSPLN